MNYYLIGFPGCGKTTLGRELSRLTGWVFIDLDEYIEHQQGRRIVELMPLVGETQFRDMERAALREVSAASAIIACGGGTPCQPGNMELMNASGITVWLTTSEERLISRLCLPEHRAKRPQIATLSDEGIARYVRSTIAQRTPFYSKASLKFDSTHIETAAETIDTARRLAHALRLPVND